MYLQKYVTIYKYIWLGQSLKFFILDAGQIWMHVNGLAAPELVLVQMFPLLTCITPFVFLMVERMDRDVVQ